MLSARVVNGSGAASGQLCQTKVLFINWEDDERQIYLPTGYQVMMAQVDEADDSGTPSGAHFVQLQFGNVSCYFLGVDLIQTKHITSVFICTFVTCCGCALSA